MIKFGDKYLRNLEEQVQYLTEYHDVNQGLVQWGIRVVGQVETAEELPLPYDGEYGDAIAVGAEAPFFFYIWTRASIAGESDYWFPFGEISIVGPQGPKGDKGDKGDTGESTSWYIQQYLTGEFKKGDKILIIANNSEKGNIYTYDPDNGGYVYNGNIRGPQGIQGLQGIQGPQGEQGPQGPKGDTGDAGAFINIRGIIDNVGQLPTPASLNNLSAAYLVGGNKELYVQVGEDPDTATWNNIGPLNAATLIMANGLAQNVWNADTKLDKVTSTGLLRAYCINPDGSQNTLSIASNPNTWKTDRITSLVRSAEGGESDRSKMESANIGYLLSPAPVQPFHTANKEYVDKNFAPNLIKDSPDSGLVQAVVLTAKQGPDPRKYAVYSISTSTAGISTGRLVQYFSANSGEEGTDVGNGRILQLDPVQPLQVANKRYVDTSTKLHHISGYINFSETVTFNIKFNIYSPCPNELLDPGLDVEDTARILSQIFKPGTAFLRSIDGSDNYTVMDMVQEITDTTITTVTDHLTLELSALHDFTDEVTEIEW